MWYTFDHVLSMLEAPNVLQKASNNTRIWYATAAYTLAGPNEGVQGVENPSTPLVFQFRTAYVSFLCCEGDSTTLPAQFFQAPPEMVKSLIQKANAN